ncbi:MAG TPA: hypothetical protein VJ063_12025 [Verrucomicrobiae bacterium]|nr:hypothetical protein [Verrucomicrobiae bacterium]
MTVPDKNKFTEALEELIGGCMSAGMHSVEFIGPLKAKLVEMRELSMPALSDEQFNQKGGLAPMSAADIRRLLELEDYEPLPKQRE